LRSNISVFTSASHGFSPPTVQETLDPEGQINPDIQPEQGWNVEVGSRGSLILGRLFFDIVAYRMRVFDLLVARRTAEDQFIGLNAGSSTHRGIELSLQYLVTKQGSPFFIQPFITAGFNAHRFEDFIDGEQNFSNNELTGVPNQLINTGIDFSHKIGLYGNLNYQYVGSMPMRDDNSLYSESYDLLNLKLGFRKTLFSRLNVDVSSGIMNVLDEKYASQILINAMAFGNAQPRYYYPGLPRNSYLSMKVSYDF
jgi:iron complex outermembrane receptor protein